MKRRDYLKLKFVGGVALLFGITPGVSTATKKAYNKLTNSIVYDIQNKITKEAKRRITKDKWEDFYVFIRIDKVQNIPDEIKIVFYNKSYGNYKASYIDDKESRKTPDFLIYNVKLMH